MSNDPDFSAGFEVLRDVKFDGGYVLSVTIENQ